MADLKDASLTDPDLPPGAVVSVDEYSGEATTNDGRVLQPAAMNRWYVLMTIAGEQDGDEIDWDRHEKNRRYWNGWACSNLGEAARADLAEKMGLTPEALAPWSTSEREKVQAEFKKRSAHPAIGRLEGENQKEVAARLRDRARAFAKLPDPGAEINLREIHFPNLVVSERCFFGGAARFDSAAFCGEAWFDFATFNFAARFDYATFAGAARFAYTAFSGAAQFGAATFSEDSFFSHANFSGDALFNSVTFCAGTVFNYATFGGYSVFGSATFCGEAWFDSAAFCKEAWFDFATFIVAARLDFATFSGAARFDYATFSENAAFSSAIFSDVAAFSFSTLCADALFDSAMFRGDARFNSATFSGTPKFLGTWFKDAAGFQDATFEKPTIFRGAAFEGAFPGLVGTVLYADTEFSAVERVSVKDESGEEVEVDAWAVAPDDPEAARASAAKIRHVMGKQGLPEEEHFFFRKEVGFAKRIGPWWQRLPYVLFWLFSNFGYSIWVPFAWLVGLITMGWGLFGSALKAAASSGGTAEIWQGLGLSIANTFPYLGFHRRYFGGWLPDFPAWIDVFGGVQTVFGGIFLFFLLLGLRTRFRLR